MSIERVSSALQPDEFEGYAKRGVHPQIRGVTYEEDFLCEDRRFPHGASFVNVTFKKKVDFKRAVFEGPAYFWNCRFLGNASFFRMRVEGKCPPVQDRLPGEVNFSYSRFEEPPSFDRAQFLGAAFFHRTVFLKGVSMEEVRFEGKTRFEGSTSDICVSHECLLERGVSDPVIKELRSKEHRILSFNTDHEEDHFNFNWNIRSEDSLRRMLRATTYGSVLDAPLAGQELTPEDEAVKGSMEAILRLWNEGMASTMFGVGTSGVAPLSSLRGSQFCAGSSFSRVDLGNCLFQGVNVSDIDFTVVDWARQPCGLVVRRLFKRFLASRPNWVQADRAALRDELQLDKDEEQFLSHHELRNRRKELSELYRELRISYDKEGDSQSGRDFYFGEVEAERLSYGETRQLLGISNWYRIFSGYSKREGLALSWLVALILIVFPLLFWGLVLRQERKLLETPYFQGNQAGSSSGPISNTRAGSEQGACELTTIIEIPARLTSQGELGTQANDAQLQKADEDHYHTLMNKATNAASGNGTFRSGAFKAIVASLQASTFLAGGQNSSIDTAAQMLESIRCTGSSDKQAAYAQAASALAGLEGHRRGLEGIERLVVPAQLGLFLLALRSKFQRTR